MDLLRTLRHVAAVFDGAGFGFALIGGVALAARGVPRATADVDLLLAVEDTPAAVAGLATLGYRIVHESLEVVQLEAPATGLVPVDILMARRAPSRGMLVRAERIHVLSDLAIPVAQTEDLIGLKVQAACNDPARALQDWADVVALVQAANTAGRSLDRARIAAYLEVFGQSAKLDALLPHVPEG